LKYITRAIWILSLVSLFTDMASEMLYPILPIYLETIGFSVVMIGVLEGVAEATAGLSKGYFGKLSDISGWRLPFVKIGYTLSALSKPIMGLFTSALWIFSARTLDRLGKGVRTAARDAMLSDQSQPETKARVFGFHRSMDTFGAVLGPGIALIYLYYFPQDYRTLFYIAFVPGLLAIAATFLLKEKAVASTSIGLTKTSFLSFLKYWKQSSSEYRGLIVGLITFTLFNSSDIFLLLKAKESGLSDTIIVGVYIFYNLVYALMAFPAGMLADKLGVKKMFVLGLVFFAITYLGMTLATDLLMFAVIFFIYGLYAAFTEGISKAWVVKLVDKKDTATAIGMYTSFQSICTLLASSVAGIVWHQFGATATFALTGGVSILLIFYFGLAVKEPARG
jgi:MFS family permease